MLKVGIVGLPNAGKSTLFNALVTKGKAQTGKHPFTTVDKNIGVVPVPDSTLHDLAKTANIKNTTEANISFVDIAGLVKGAHQGEGLGNQFLAHIREVDVILHVVRFFHDESIPHMHTEIDPKEDVEIVNTELMLADAASLELQLESLKKSHSDQSSPRLRPASKTSRDKEAKALTSLAEKVLSGLNDGKAASDILLSDKERDLLFNFNLLTDKPVVYVVNNDENKLKQPVPTNFNKFKPVITISAKFEEELAKLPWTEQRQFLKTYGVKQSALRSVITQCYDALNLLTFYTIAGGKEARAWSLERGKTALDAAAKVHTDFAKHFIKAEVIVADLLLKLGSWKAAHDAGKVQLVGKDHEVHDGDVIEFKVSV